MPYLQCQCPEQSNLLIVAEFNLGGKTRHHQWSLPHHGRRHCRLDGPVRVHKRRSPSHFSIVPNRRRAVQFKVFLRCRGPRRTLASSSFAPRLTSCGQPEVPDQPALKTSRGHLRTMCAGMLMRWKRRCRSAVGSQQENTLSIRNPRSLAYLNTGMGLPDPSWKEK